MKKTTMLKKNYEFRAVLTKGKIFKQKEIEIFIYKNNKNKNFLGIAIGSKNGIAFQRNRAKRIIRECYTKLENQLTEGNSVVILLNKNYSIEEISFVEILKEMQKIFEDANILKKEEEIWKKYVYI